MTAKKAKSAEAESPAAAAADAGFMRDVLALAERGRFTAPPNPMVGAVVVKAGKIVGSGFHARAGEAHAEPQALAAAGRAARGATLYTNLEPCNHAGQTPPCCDAIIEAGIARVVSALADPNPHVAGGGLKRLKRRGIEVALGVLAEEARRQNDRWLISIVRGTPFVVLKAAASLDGKIATETGESRWISGETARRRAMELREEMDAVMVGAGTVERDDPLLTRRLGLARGRDHWRVVVDSHLRLSPRHRMLVAPAGRVRIYTLLGAPRSRSRELAAAGADVVEVAGRAGRVDIALVLADLARAGVTGLLVEGGAELLGTFMAQALWDRFDLHLSPRFIGGSRAPSLLGSWAARELAATPRLSRLQLAPLGEDILVSGYRES